MLSQNQLVKVRKVIESMYDKTCTVVIQEEYEKPNGATGFRDAILLEEEPCHIDFNSISSSEQGEAVASVSQEIRLFISPDVEIPAGSKIAADSVSYAHSGVAAKYATHQEIILKLWEKQA